MKRETNSINTACSLKSGKQLFLECLIHLPLPLTVRHSTSYDGWNHLIPCRKQGGNHPADTVVLNGVEHFTAPSDTNILPTCKNWIECIGLVVHTTDYDAFHLVDSLFNGALQKRTPPPSTRRGISHLGNAVKEREHIDCCPL
ncbi:hypothetical protein SDC9_204773 [bioreactor metagenome]|uniref:Uncharacterized protein n=1 Tax=bioreactor metagenome TaxID=1076179 RepID=A0A645J2Y1_9ZZZZ